MRICRNKIASTYLPPVAPAARRPNYLTFKTHAGLDVGVISLLQTVISNMYSFQTPCVKHLRPDQGGSASVRKRPEEPRLLLNTGLSQSHFEPQSSHRGGQA